MPRQANNVYVFPGLGLGVVASGATRVTDSMFLAAARTLADCVTDADLAQGSLYPPLERIRDVSVRIAAAVCRVAVEEGLATAELPGEALEGWLADRMYQPNYR